ncbi:hypothetical protein F7R20_03905 [Pseudomonas brassicacearum subsp. brassicacearum]|nr:hypothetical protein F7R20_03905 [Pseudomonas brassicacearum subsp. brassicacearum]PJH89933.1 hypothetical protein CVG87_04475 [Pseudomonas sp. WCS365]QEO77984.1 hypothetical protein ELZ14_10580 [Pseudomonas brassicacearum]
MEKQTQAGQAQGWRRTAQGEQGQGDLSSGSPKTWNLWQKICGSKALWEQGLPAKQATRFQIDRVIFIAGKPCSHR